MRIDRLDYELPEELIAQEPLPDRTAAGLLVVPASPDAPFAHRRVADLPSLLRGPALWVFNDTRVIPARLRGEKSATGGRVELLLVAPTDDAPAATDWQALGRASKGLRVGDRLAFPSRGEPRLEAEVRARGDAASAPGTVQVRLTAVDGVSPIPRLIEEVGSVPLPPYVRREPTADDAARYQTVYARHPGAVAAPTAGLHFTDELLAALRQAGQELTTVTLHVGPGTFAPLRADDLGDHVMHEERYEVPDAAARAFASARQAGRPVIAVGTTVVRTLESAAAADGRTLRVGWGRTDLFIRPPYRFRAVDGLLTNFHLPRSTLLALVMAFRGVDRVRDAYAEAVRARYRFFSYGDAMFLPPAVPGTPR